jgi:UDPglucose 6-dehydrogenase
MNELANFCEKVGANVDLVRKGMGADSRIGKRFLFPGIGYGGSCFPKDVNAFIKTSRDYNSPMELLELVDKLNKNQKTVLVRKILKHFQNGKKLKNKKFAIWGLAFKPNTDDVREAPSIYIIKRLLHLGAKISVYDPEATENMKFHFKEDEIEYCSDKYDALNNADALLILTEWNEFRNPNFDIISSKLKNNLIFDGRNIFDVKQMKEMNFTYYSIGR